MHILRQMETIVYLFVLGHYLFLEAHSFPRATLSEQIMFADKYPSIFSRQMETIVCMCNQMVTSEMREYFHVRFVKILLLSRAVRRGKLLEFDKTQVKLFPNFRRKSFDYFLIMGDKLRSQSWVFELFNISRTPRIEKFKACILA